MPYVVEVKRSARRVSTAAGNWVNRNGAVRRFESKTTAREWAAAVTEGRTVWVQDAHPVDDEVDGYVVGGRRTRPRRHQNPGEQLTLALD